MGKVFLVAVGAGVVTGLGLQIWDSTIGPMIARALGGFAGNRGGAA